MSRRCWRIYFCIAFDTWLQRHYPDIPFERYADDAVCHCRSKAQAEDLKTALENRLAECGLTMHPDKTVIVYCKDDNRLKRYPINAFDFLGYTFAPRRSKNRWGKYFVSFSPAISQKAATAIRQEIRSWKLQLCSDKALETLARMFNARIRGWINYYSAFCKSALFRVLRFIDRKLVKWATRKFKRLKVRQRRATRWLARIAQRQPGMFAHWRLSQGMTG